METEKQLSVKMLITLLQSEYPNSFVNLDERLMKLKIELWEREFANDDLTIVYVAIRTYIRSQEKFAPTIGQIRAKMDDLAQPDRLSEVDAWALVSNACANGLYGYREEFEKLPPNVQAAVGQPEQLRQWAMMDNDTVESVVASNFMRTFRAKEKHEKELAMIPADVKQLLTATADKMQLEAAKPKELPASTVAEITPQSKFTPPPLEIHVEPPPEPYNPPSEAEFEEKRAAAIRMLEAIS